jgi:hypothetical protein
MGYLRRGRQLRSAIDVLARARPRTPRLALDTRKGQPIGPEVSRLAFESVWALWKIPGSGNSGPRIILGCPALCVPGSLVRFGVVGWCGAVAVWDDGGWFPCLAMQRSWSGPRRAGRSGTNPLPARDLLANYPEARFARWKPHPGQSAEIPSAGALIMGLDGVEGTLGP